MTLSSVLSGDRAWHVECGDVLEELRGMPSESVHCVITSPPYWGLRDYGIEPTIWGGDADCQHEWGEEIPLKRQSNWNTFDDYNTDGNPRVLGTGPVHGASSISSASRSARSSSSWRSEKPVPTRPA